MDKLGLKIPMLTFFLGVVYFASEGLDVVDAVIKSFILAFGIALIILVFTMLLMFFLTLQKNRSDNMKISSADERVQNMSLQEKKVEMHA
jgi:ABC-type Fe3+ transport system permease subunit